MDADVAAPVEGDLQGPPPPPPEMSSSPGGAAETNAPDPAAPADSAPVCQPAPPESSPAPATSESAPPASESAPAAPTSESAPAAPASESAPAAPGTGEAPQSAPDAPSAPAAHGAPDPSAPDPSAPDPSAPDPTAPAPAAPAPGAGAQPSVRLRIRKSGDADWSPTGTVQVQGDRTVDLEWESENADAVELAPLGTQPPTGQATVPASDVEYSAVAIRGELRSDPALALVGTHPDDVVVSDHVVVGPGLKPVQISSITIEPDTVQPDASTPAVIRWQLEGDPKAAWLVTPGARTQVTGQDSASVVCDPSWMVEGQDLAFSLEVTGQDGSTDTGQVKARIGEGRPAPEAILTVTSVDGEATEGPLTARKTELVRFRVRARHADQARIEFSDTSAETQAAFRNVIVQSFDLTPDGEGWAEGETTASVLEGSYSAVASRRPARWCPPIESPRSGQVIIHLRDATAAEKKQEGKPLFKLPDFDQELKLSSNKRMAASIADAGLGECLEVKTEFTVRVKGSFEGSAEFSTKLDSASDADGLVKAELAEEVSRSWYKSDPADDEAGWLAHLFEPVEVKGKLKFASPLTQSEADQKKNGRKYLGVSGTVSVNFGEFFHGDAALKLLEIGRDAKTGELGVTAGELKLDLVGEKPAFEVLVKGAGTYTITLKVYGWLVVKPRLVKLLQELFGEVTIEDVAAASVELAPVALLTGVLVYAQYQAIRQAEDLAALPGSVAPLCEILSDWFMDGLCRYPAPAHPALQRVWQLGRDLFARLAASAAQSGLTDPEQVQAMIRQEVDDDPQGVRAAVHLTWDAAQPDPHRLHKIARQLLWLDFLRTHQRSLADAQQSFAMLFGFVPDTKPDYHREHHPAETAFYYQILHDLNAGLDPYGDWDDYVEHGEGGLVKLACDAGLVPIGADQLSELVHAQSCAVMRAFLDGVAGGKPVPTGALERVAFSWGAAEGGGSPHDVSADREALWDVEWRTLAVGLWPARYAERVQQLARIRVWLSWARAYSTETERRNGWGAIFGAAPGSSDLFARTDGLLRVRHLE